MRKVTDENVHNGLGWIGTLLKYIKEYGIFNIIKSCLLLILISLTIRISYNPTFFFDKYTRYLEEKHKAELTVRTTNDAKIKEYLPKCLLTSGADRAWIMHYHNGVSDWMYASMRFEYCRNGIASVKEQYVQVHLSWITLPEYLKTHNKFIGTVEQIKTIDSVLYHRFKANNIQYIACILLWDVSGRPSGILGFTWEYKIDESTLQIMSDNLSRWSTVLSQYIKL